MLPGAESELPFGLPATASPRRRLRTQKPTPGLLAGNAGEANGLYLNNGTNDPFNGVGGTVVGSLLKRPEMSIFRPNDWKTSREPIVTPQQLSKCLCSRGPEHGIACSSGVPSTA